MVCRAMRLPLLGRAATARASHFRTRFRMFKQGHGLRLVFPDDAAECERLRRDKLVVQPPRFGRACLTRHPSPRLLFHALVETGIMGGTYLVAAFAELRHLANSFAPCTTSNTTRSR